MKFYKIISKTVVATTFLGVTLGGAFSSISASANANTPSINNTDNTPNESVSSNNNNNETASSKSPSNFQINSNTLTLDSVPSLNFGSNSNTNPSQSGSSILPLNNDNNSGDNSRLLEVTDYRKGSNVNTWNLNASMSNVQGGSKNQQGINDEWRLDLYNKSQNLDNSDTPYTAQDTALTYDTNNTTNNNGNQQVMKSDGNDGSNGHNTEGYGVNQIKYDNKNSAKLTIPNVAPGNYTADINWQLSTGVSEQDNG